MSFSSDLIYCSKDSRVGVGPDVVVPEFPLPLDIG